MCNNALTPDVFPDRARLETEACHCAMRDKEIPVAVDILRSLQDVIVPDVMHNDEKEHEKEKLHFPRTPSSIRQKKSRR